MSQILVTGAAGFIGSCLCERLISLGYTVTGIDNLTEYYNPSIKRKNLQRLISNHRFTLIEEDICRLDLKHILRNKDIVFHLAAQPGVRASLGKGFSDYLYANVQATQILLEACIDMPLRRFVFASSSSIYGNAEAFPTLEDALPAPISPYGITKLSAEHLVTVYNRSFGIPTVSLRLFTVYGARQRPDMAFRIFMDSIRKGEAITIYGNGKQTRDFTYIDDIIDGFIAAASKDKEGQIINIGGGSRHSLLEAVGLIEDISGIKPVIEFKDSSSIDAKDTSADISKAKSLLDYRPQVSLEEGLRMMWQNL